MSMTLVFTQILVILLYVLIGFAAGKLKVINPEQRKYLTGLCSNLILPFTILSASSQRLDEQGLASLGLTAAVMFGLFGATICVSLLYHKLRKSGRGVRAAFTSLVTYPNCTFLGLPLCTALFGEIAVLYNAAALLAFNVFFFSVQYTLFTGRSFSARNLLTPPMVSTAALIVMLVLKLHFPSPVQTVVSATGAMITPLSLIIIGVMLSENRLSAVFLEKRAYIVTLIRNLVIPLCAIAVLRLLPLTPDDRLCVLVYIGTPCATLTTIYSIRCDTEPELCARSVLLSTVCFAGTLPLIIWLGRMLLG